MRARVSGACRLDRFPAQRIDADGSVDRRNWRLSWPSLVLRFPQALRPVWVVLMVINYPIGWVITHVVMAIIFYLVVTPVGIIMRLTGRDPMERAFDRTAKTYWKPRRTDPDSARYFRQY